MFSFWNLFFYSPLFYGASSFENVKLFGMDFSFGSRVRFNLFSDGLRLLKLCCIIPNLSQGQINR